MGKGNNRIGASLYERVLWWKPGGGLLYWENPKEMPSKTLEIGVCFLRGPAFLETWWDTSFLGPLRKGDRFFIKGVLWGVWGIRKKAQKTGSIPHRGNCWQYGWDLFFWDIFREKENHIWVSFSWDKSI